MSHGVLPCHGKPTVWHVGGNDVYMRVPLLLELRKRGFVVGAVGSHSHPHFETHSIPFCHYPLSSKASPAADLRAKRVLVNLFRRHAPHVVHAFDTRPAILAPLAARDACVGRCIRTITGMGRVFSSTTVAAQAARAVYRTVQRRVSRHCFTVFQNQDDQEYFQSYRMVPPGQHALIAGSGIDSTEFERRAADSGLRRRLIDELGIDSKPIVTMVARLIPEKGVREFLRAAAIVCQEGIRTKFLLVGPLANEGRHRITMDEIKLYAEFVTYLGTREDIPAILSLTDVFVLPTYYREGIPRVLLEAGALGIPLVTTDTVGCRDVVRHEIEGLIVPDRDSVALSQALIKLLRSEALRKQLGGRARQRVEEHFSLSRVADAYAALYTADLNVA